MKKGIIIGISLVALIVSVVGVLIALTAYMKKRKEDDCENDMYEYCEDIPVDADLEAMLDDAGFDNEQELEEYVDELLAQAEGLAAETEDK